MKGSIFDPTGQRLYLTPGERLHFMQTANQLASSKRTLCMTLAFTGCRISEALNLTKERIDVAAKTLVFETLKKRKRGVFRMVPVPTDFIDELLLFAQTIKAGDRLWPMCRTSGYLTVKQAMRVAGIAGACACPKGLRHAFAVHALSKGVPLNLIQKWMGHSSIETTSIYLNAVGAEERAIANRMWGDPEWDGNSGSVFVAMDD